VTTPSGVVDLDSLMHTHDWGAILEATKANEAEPADCPSLVAYARGAALLHLGRPREALPLLEQAARDPVRAFWAHHFSGRAHQALLDPAAAARAYRDAHRTWAEPINLSLFVDAALTVLGSDAAQTERAALARDLANLWQDRPSDASARSPPDLGPRLDVLERELADQGERLRDVDMQAARRPWTQPFRLRTEHPVALDSDDHRHPRGAATDNTRSPRFVRTCEVLLRSPLRALDLGCAGGGLVRDFLLRGHRAAGVEGSDFPLRSQRGEWRTIPDHLFTADVLEPFELSEADGKPAAFEVITAWEVLEHLPRARLPGFFGNVRRHLAPDGLFVASVALFRDDDPVTGAVWHVTLESKDWWSERLHEAGLEAVDSPFSPQDYVRGSGAGPDDWDGAARPDLGFHLVARRHGG